MDLLRRYLEKGGKSRGAMATLATLDHLNDVAPEVAEATVKELIDQRRHLKLIASENHCSLAVQHAMGNWLTDKYSEGFIGHRFYAGCENVDTVEQRAVDLLKEIYGCDHAYVQPHSGADANLVAFLAILMQRVQDPEIEKLGKKGVNGLTKEEHEKIRQLMVNQKIMGLALDCGGHLTHGYPLNISSKIFKAESYRVDPESERLDYDAIEKQVKEYEPAILIVGHSAYPRLIDFEKMRKIADTVGATLMVDMAHFSGLVAGKVLTGVHNPIPYADIVTSTTHKTLRGPRGGMVLCKEYMKPYVDKGCPYVLGGPLPHVMAAKAVAFAEALTPEFSEYAHQVVKNAQAMANAFMEEGAKLFTDGTDNHLIVVDVEKSFGLNGKQAEHALVQAGVIVNRNTVPNDPNGAWFTSGIRLGSPALTTRGMKEAEMAQVAQMICKLLRGAKGVTKNTSEVDAGVLTTVCDEIDALLKNFPLYPEIDIEQTADIS